MMRVMSRWNRCHSKDLGESEPERLNWRFTVSQFQLQINYRNEQPLNGNDTGS